MITTNVVNNALCVDLDTYLEPFRLLATDAQAGRQGTAR
jgi:hypothetical protein